MYDNDTVEYYSIYILNLVADVRLRIFLPSTEIFIKSQNSRESKYDSQECAPAGSIHSKYDS